MLVKWVSSIKEAATILNQIRASLFNKHRKRFFDSLYPSNALIAPLRVAPTMVDRYLHNLDYCTNLSV